MKVIRCDGCGMVVNEHSIGGGDVFSEVLEFRTPMISDNNKPDFVKVSVSIGYPRGTDLCITCLGKMRSDVIDMLRKSSPNVIYANGK